MLLLLFTLVIFWLLLKGFFKIVLPILILLLIGRLIFGSLLLLFSPHFLGFLLVAAFIYWLIKASRPRRY